MFLRYEHFFLFVLGTEETIPAVECAHSGENRRVTVEVGGGSKGRGKSDFVIRDDSDYPAAGAVPLWLLGMMC